MTQRVWVRPHTTWDTYRLCSGFSERGLTQVVSERSPCPHCPRLLAPQEMTSSGVMATVCWSLPLAASQSCLLLKCRLLHGLLPDTGRARNAQLVSSSLGSEQQPA